MNEDDLDQERLGNLETLEKRSNRLRGGVTTFVGIVFLITGPIVGYDITHSLVWSFVVGYACLFGIIVGPAILINFLILSLKNSPTLEAE